MDVRRGLNIWVATLVDIGLKGGGTGGWEGTRMTMTMTMTMTVGVYNLHVAIPLSPNRALLPVTVL